MVNLFEQGKTAAPISLAYNGRIVRNPSQKTVTKIAGVSSFRIQPGASHAENLRFLNRQIFDLKEGL
jgi:hypothetical protein